ncbi:MAG: hypothetical protein LBV33_05390 [Lachnospiraceae bacterium]|jgi:predicted enzyme related to lactoylglutathione lyase|nr:hypothetical protein [Lachnospiraceae bacterium]
MRLGEIVIDSDNIEELSGFYAQLLGWTKSSQIHEGEKWIIVAKEDYSEAPIIFQENPDYRRPKWPVDRSDKEAQQQMIHLDFYVTMTEFSGAVGHAIECGAQICATQFTDSWTVLIDPSGHPFCIIPIPDEVYQQRYN